ncbi:hypothetical protein BHM03_00001074 [Ensete ventricosum]|uniref:Uncharacterized protein n=1 Tax=Ensete ventricosum TaxID=4639 RepID=A0A445M8W9_ENSVE|nr:hypothetical protein BHM03_00001074 [Ensete ventricosum]
MTCWRPFGSLGHYRPSCCGRQWKNTRRRSGSSWDYSEPVRFHMNMGTRWLWPDSGPRYPDLEIEENAFTIRLEDDLVPMEDEQSFDDSVPP